MKYFAAICRNFIICIETIYIYIYTYRYVCYKMNDVREIYLKTRCVSVSMCASYSKDWNDYFGICERWVRFKKEKRVNISRERNVSSSRISFSPSISNGLLRNGTKVFSNVPLLLCFKGQGAIYSALQSQRCLVH